MPAMVMLHEMDPKQVILDKLGSVDGFEVCHNQVLCAVYERPQKTKSGILLADSTRDEDRTQGKVALVVKKGPQAFVDSKDWKFPDVQVGDWVYFRASDGWSITVNGKLCRMFVDEDIRGRIEHPDMVW